jgi:hypothetical protein
MSAKTPFLAPLKSAVRAFFKNDLALQRADGGVRLVLHERGQPVARPPTRAEAAQRKDERELAQAREDLARVLDDDPASRSTMRHLAFVEHALEKKGWRALHKVPLDVLRKALEQLEAQVTNWSPVGLACLRSKMAVAVIDRDHHDPEPGPESDLESDAYRTAAVLESPPVLAARAIEAAKSSSEDDAALLAAYAALGDALPVAVELQGELGSRSGQALARDGARSGANGPQPLSLRDLQG